MNLRLRTTDPIFLASVLVALVCLAIVGAEAWRMSSARQAQIGESETAAANLARSLGRHATDALIEADLVAMNVVDRFQAGGINPATVEQVHRLLVRTMPGLPQLQRLSVIDAEGLWVTTDLPSNNPGVGHVDREYFEYHRTHTDKGPHLGPPIRSRTTDQWILTVSRRIDRPDGSFGGVMLASIDLLFFDRYYKQFDVGDDGAILLALSDGTMLDRLPFRPGLVGTNLSKGPLFAEIRRSNGSGHVHIVSQIDGIERLTAFHQLDGFPAYVVVAFSKNEVLGNWVTDSIINGVGAVLLIVALVLIGRRLIAQLRQRQADQLQLIESQAQLELLNQKLDGLASEDALTKLANRRAFDRVIRDEVKRVDRSGGPLSLIMVDVDRFKAYNDYYGHPKGDACLRAIAGQITACTNRPGDFAARLGGEEFVILLPSTDLDGALAIAENLRIAIRALGLEHPSSAKGVVTVSMGIGVLVAGRGDATWEALVEQADKALYAAKENGRDSIRAHDLLPASTVVAPTSPTISLIGV